MCKSDIWSYYALSFYMKEEQLQQELCHQYEQEFKPYVVVENGYKEFFTFKTILS